MAHLRSISLLGMIFMSAALNHCNAIDYPGGWILPAKKQCVNICPNTERPSGLHKNQPGDWDYSLVEQMFLPQYCRELDRGVDITLSHQNVLPYPSGIRCSPKEVPTSLTIHGLWFDYYDGYPACCNYTSSNTNVPYDPFALLNNYSDVVRQMDINWIDPAVPSHDSLCVLYNHEFQKHGTCYSGAFTPDPLKAASLYFQATLDVTQRVLNATTSLNSYAERQQPISVQQIEQLYSKKVQVFCSNTQPSNQFAVIHTCWGKTSQFTVGPQIDCPPATPSSLFIPCDANVNVTLQQYRPPQ